MPSHPSVALWIKPGAHYALLARQLASQLASPPNRRLENCVGVSVSVLLQEGDGNGAGSPRLVLAALFSSRRLMEIYREGGQGPAGQKELLLLVRSMEGLRYAFEKLAGGAAGEKQVGIGL